MKQKIEEWIRGHPIEAFFLLTIVMSFGLLFPVFLIISQEDVLGQILSLFLGRIGTFSPVLAGMFVARIIQPGRQRVSLTRRLSVFLPVWFIAAIVHTARLNLDAEPGTPLIALLVVSLPVALLPAFVISSAFSGADGVKKMLPTLVRPKGSIVYYLINQREQFICGFGITLLYRVQNAGYIGHTSSQSQISFCQGVSVPTGRISTLDDDTLTQRFGQS